MKLTDLYSNKRKTEKEKKKSIKKELKFLRNWEKRKWNWGRTATKEDVEDATNLTH